MEYPTNEIRSGSAEANAAYDAKCRADQRDRQQAQQIRGLGDPLHPREIAEHEKNQQLRHQLDRAAIGANAVRQWDSRHAAVLRDLERQRAELLKLRAEAQELVTLALEPLGFTPHMCGLLVSYASEVRGALHHFDSNAPR